MSKITESARGEQCQVRIPGVCNRDPETTVFAHLNGGGMGMKQPDCEGAYCCSACHDVVDGRVKWFAPIYGMLGWDERDEVNKTFLMFLFYQGCVRTRAKLIEKGLLICL